MKTILLLLFVLIVLSFSTLYTLAVREDFSGSTFPPIGWINVAKSPGGGMAYGGWSLLAGAAHGEVYGSYITAYAILFTPAIHLKAGEQLIIIFQGKPWASPDYCPLLVLENNGKLIWSDYIKPADSQWHSFQFEITDINEESYNYHVGWEVDDWLNPICRSTLDIDNVKVIIVDPSTGNKLSTQVEVRSLGRVKSLYK